MLLGRPGRRSLRQGLAVEAVSQDGLHAAQAQRPHGQRSLAGGLHALGSVPLAEALDAEAGAEALLGVATRLHHPLEQLDHAGAGLLGPAEQAVWRPIGMAAVTFAEAQPQNFTNLTHGESRTWHRRLLGRWLGSKESCRASATSRRRSQRSVRDRGPPRDRRSTLRRSRSQARATTARMEPGHSSQDRLNRPRFFRDSAAWICATALASH